MTSSTKPIAASSTTQKQQPERKISLAGGIGVAIWLNTINTDNGTRQVRSFTIDPRRYRDSKSGEWKDSKSFSVGDLPALIFALTKAQEYCFEQPIPGHESTTNTDSAGEIPF